MKLAIGNDHSAVEMKKEIKKYLEDKGIEVIDVGTRYALSPQKRTRNLTARFLHIPGRPMSRKMGIGRICHASLGRPVFLTSGFDSATQDGCWFGVLSPTSGIERTAHAQARLRKRPGTP